MGFVFVVLLFLPAAAFAAFQQGNNKNITRTTNRTFVVDPYDYADENVTFVSLIARADYHPAYSMSIDNTTAPSITCEGGNASFTCPVPVKIVSVSPTKIVLTAAISAATPPFQVAVKFAEKGVLLARIPVVSR